MIYGDQSSIFFVFVMTTISAFVIITNPLLLNNCSRHFEACRHSIGSSCNFSRLFFTGMQKMSEGEEYIIHLPLILWAGFDKFDKWRKLGRVLNKNVLNVQFRSHKIQRILGTRLYTCTKSAQFILNPPFACLESKKKSVVLQNWVGKWTDIVLNRDLKNFAGFP